MAFSCLIVDDEELARDLMESYVLELPELSLVGKCRSVQEAIQALEKHTIDIIFLDVQMPRKTGVEWLREASLDAKVIFTTAYPDYALDGFQLQATDYLLKPIAFDRFRQAVEKVVGQLGQAMKAAAYDAQQTFEDQFLMVHADHNHHKLYFKDIIYVESMKEYVQYHTPTKRLLELNALKNVDALLPDTHFMRIHRSYIVAIRHIESYQNGKIVLKSPIQLPVGKTYKKEVVGRLFKDD